jgi:hypothetical protein
MKCNRIPVVFAPLSTLTEKSLKGLHSWEAILRITHNKEADVTADWNSARTTNSEYQFAKDLHKQAARSRKSADKNTAVFITLVRENLKPMLGSSYSIAWNKVGFVNGSLAVPRTTERRLSLMKSIELFFTTQPEREIADVISAVIAKEVHDRLVNAISAADKARSEQRRCKSVRDAAVAVLRLRMQNLYRELKQFLGRDDQRWLEFGFNVPGDVSVPAAPKDLTVVSSATGRALLSWTRGVRVSRYRVARQVVSVDAEPVFVKTVTDTSVHLGDLPSGARVRFYVTAANEAGESLPSETVEIVVA